MASHLIRSIENRVQISRVSVFLFFFARIYFFGLGCCSFGDIYAFLYIFIYQNFDIFLNQNSVVWVLKLSNYDTQKNMLKT